MSSKRLHIISFDVPFPADYGGVIDVFFKIKTLHAAGIKIILHCFEYGRSPQLELEKYAEQVFYYPRKNYRSLLFNTLPFIILTRKSELLKERLLNDNDPILMEGLHSTLLLNDPLFANRKIIVRTHNVEHDYYNSLAAIEKNIFKRYYFYNEAGKLAKYESVLKKASLIAPISPADTEHFKSINSNSIYIPAFHPFDAVQISTDNENYFLYHGNLAIGENNEAALYLINEIFKKLPLKLIIAGNKPSSDLQKAVSENKNIELKQNCSPEEIYQLITKAKCNILPTFQSTGIKLKLLAALYSGQYCIVNLPMVENTGLESLCEVCKDTEEMTKTVIRIAETKTFPLESIQKRIKILSSQFNSDSSAAKLIDAIFSEGL